MKKKIYLIITIILFVIFLVGLFLIYRNNENSKKIILRSNEFIFELGEDISADVSYYLKDADSIKNIKDYEILSDKLKINNKTFILKNENMVEIGNYNLMIKYKNNSKKFVIKVVDTIPPEFIKYKETIEVEEGIKDFDIKSYYKVKDLSEVNIEVKGDYDLSKAGEYKISIIATDLSYNKCEKQTLLRVIKKEVSKEQINNVGTNKEKIPVNKGNNNSDSSVKQETPVSTTPKYRTDISNLYVRQINEYRKANGLSELSVTTEAQTEANRRAKEISTYYSHDGAGYGFGENIGEGSVGVDFFVAWKNSPSHNAAMLREQNTAIAASVYEINNHWYAVVSFKMDY